MKSKGCEQSKVMITIRMDYSGPFESESALKYISSCDEVTHDNKPLTAGSIVPLPVRPFLFFFLPLNVECVSLYWVGRSVGLKKRKTEKKKKKFKKSLNMRPGTPASLLWSLETTRHEPKRIWRKRWLMLL